MVPAGTHTPDRELYLRVIFLFYFKQGNIHTPFGLITNRIWFRSMPSWAGKRQNRASVLGFCIHSHYRPAFMAYFCDVVSVFFQRSLKPKDKNRLLRARKSSIFFYLQSMEGAVVSSVLGGFSHFSELKLLGFCALLCCMLPSISPAAKYPIPTPKYHTYLRRAVPTANGACAGEMASPSYGIDTSSSSTTAKW